MRCFSFQFVLVKGFIHVGLILFSASHLRSDNDRKQNFYVYYTSRSTLGRRIGPPRTYNIHTSGQTNAGCAACRCCGYRTNGLLPAVLHRAGKKCSTGSTRVQHKNDGYYTQQHRPKAPTSSLLLGGATTANSDVGAMSELEST